MFPIVETPLLSIENNDKVQRTRAVIMRVANMVEGAYVELCEIWAEELKPESKFSMKKHVTSMMRRIIPMGVATGGVWSMNVRALRHICELRTSDAAEEEIAAVAGQILEIMTKEEPTLLGDFQKLEGGAWTVKYHKV